MYADDHQLYEMGEDLAKVKLSIAGNAEKASRWYEVNLLKGNFSIYKTMLMHNDDKVTTSLNLNIQGNEIELTDKLPLLRVSIDCNLNFSDHIKMAAYLNEISNPLNPCYVSNIRQYGDACVLHMLAVYYIILVSLRPSFSNEGTFSVRAREKLWKQLIDVHKSAGLNREKKPSKGVC